MIALAKPVALGIDSQERAASLLTNVHRYRITDRTARDPPRRPKAYIAGTRISVQDIYVAHELAGRTPDEIVAAYPHLTLSQVYAALSYCFDHLAEIREQLRSDSAFVEEMKTLTGLGPLARKLGRKDGNGDHVPS